MKIKKEKRIAVAYISGDRFENNLMFVFNLVKAQKHGIFMTNGKLYRMLENGRLEFSRLLGDREVPRVTGRAITPNY